MLCPFCCARELIRYNKETDSWFVCCEGAHKIMVEHMRQLVGEVPKNMEIEKGKTFKDIPWTIPSK